MKFSRIVCGTALVVVGTLALVSANQYGGGYNQNSGALTHYGGGGCQGQDCYNRASSPMAHSGSSYGPYHSYAVKPAVYGGHGLYTYKGYSRHQSAPAALYRRQRSYGSQASQYRQHQPSYGGQSRHYAPSHHQMASYSMRPQQAARHYSNNNSNNYQQARPSYHQQAMHAAPAPSYQRGGHYRATRGAYGGGNASSGHGSRGKYNNGASNKQQSYGSNSNKGYKASSGGY